MRNRRPIGLKRGPAARGPASVGGKALGGYDILTITDNGFGLALVTTAAPHGLGESVNVTVTGSSVPEYNVTDLASPQTATTFNLDVTLYTTDATGGRWTLA